MNEFVTLNEEEQADFVRRFFDMFAGRLETYAIRVEKEGERAKYVPSNHPSVERQVAAIGTDEFTEEVVRAHLEGRELLGVYPIMADGKVNFFALDFDGKNGDPLREAIDQQTEFSLVGLTTYLERSQSGNGFHLWGFLEAPVEAHRIRHAIKPIIFDTATYDRMFPNQDGITELRPLGNLIALPFAGSRITDGNSTFGRRLNGEFIPMGSPKQFVEQAKVIPTSDIDALFERAGEYKPERTHRTYEGDPEGLRDGWKVTDLRFGCEFMAWAHNNPSELSEELWYAIACNLAQVEGGRDLFHELSSQDTKRYDPDVTDAKYDQAIAQNKPHGCETIRAMGGNCNCDTRFPGKVYHPFDLAKISFKALVESVMTDNSGEADVMEAAAGFDLAIEWAEAVEKDPSLGQGRQYGIPSIDDKTGLRDSDLVIIAARPAMGKSALACSITDNGCMSGVPNYVFSAEMSKLQWFKRQLACRAGVNATRMATGKLTAADWSHIRTAQQLVRDQSAYPLFVDDLSRSTDRIFEVAARLVHLHGKGVVWIDYLQLLQRLPKESMFDAVTRITHDLKMLAKALDVPVVALTQLNRTADDATGDSETNDSWLRGSGDIEQAADVIVFILGDKGSGVMRRIFAIHKERHRDPGHRIDLEFNQPIMRFAEAGTFNITQPKPEIKRRPGAPTVTNEAPDMTPQPLISTADLVGGI